MTRETAEETIKKVIEDMQKKEVFKKAVEFKQKIRSMTDEALKNGLDDSTAQFFLQQVTSLEENLPKEQKIALLAMSGARSILGREVNINNSRDLSLSQDYMNFLVTDDLSKGSNLYDAIEIYRNIVLPIKRRNEAWSSTLRTLDLTSISVEGLGAVAFINPYILGLAVTWGVGRTVTGTWLETQLKHEIPSKYYIQISDFIDQEPNPLFRIGYVDKLDAMGIKLKPEHAAKRRSVYQNALKTAADKNSNNNRDPLPQEIIDVIKGRVKKNKFNPGADRKKTEGVHNQKKSDNIHSKSKNSQPSKKPEGHFEAGKQQAEEGKPLKPEKETEPFTQGKEEWLVNFAQKEFETLEQKVDELHNFLKDEKKERTDKENKLNDQNNLVYKVEVALRGAELASNFAQFLLGDTNPEAAKKLGQISGLLISLGSAVATIISGGTALGVIAVFNALFSAGKVNDSASEYILSKLLPIVNRIEEKTTMLITMADFSNFKMDVHHKDTLRNLARMSGYLVKIDRTTNQHSIDMTNFRNEVRQDASEQEFLKYSETEIIVENSKSFKTESTKFVDNFNNILHLIYNVPKLSVLTSINTKFYTDEKLNLSEIKGRVSQNLQNSIGLLFSLAKKIHDDQKLDSNLELRDVINLPAYYDGVRLLIDYLLAVDWDIIKNAYLQNVDPTNDIIKKLDKVISVGESMASNIDNLVQSPAVFKDLFDKYQEYHQDVMNIMIEDFEKHEKEQYQVSTLNLVGELLGYSENINKITAPKVYKKKQLTHCSPSIRMSESCFQYLFVAVEHDDKINDFISEKKQKIKEKFSALIDRAKAMDGTILDDGSSFTFSRMFENQKLPSLLFSHIMYPDAKNGPKHRISLPLPLPITMVYPWNTWGERAGTWTNQGLFKHYGVFVAAESMRIGIIRHEYSTHGPLLWNVYFNTTINSREEKILFSSMKFPDYHDITFDHELRRDPTNTNRFNISEDYPSILSIWPVEKHDDSLVETLTQEFKTESADRVKGLIEQKKSEVVNSFYQKIQGKNPEINLSLLEAIQKMDFYSLMIKAYSSLIMIRNDGSKLFFNQEKYLWDEKKLRDVMSSDKQPTPKELVSHLRDDLKKIQKYSDCFSEITGLHKEGASQKEFGKHSDQNGCPEFGKPIIGNFLLEATLLKLKSIRTVYLTPEPVFDFPYEEYVLPKREPDINNFDSTFECEFTEDKRFSEIKNKSKIDDAQKENIQKEEPNEPLPPHTKCTCVNNGSGTCGVEEDEFDDSICRTIKEPVKNNPNEKSKPLKQSSSASRPISFLTAPLAWFEAAKDFVQYTFNHQASQRVNSGMNETQHRVPLAEQEINEATIITEVAYDILASIRTENEDEFDHSIPDTNTAKKLIRIDVSNENLETAPKVVLVSAASSFQPEKIITSLTTAPWFFSGSDEFAQKNKRPYNATSCAFEPEFDSEKGGFIFTCYAYNDTKPVGYVKFFNAPEFCASEDKSQYNIVEMDGIFTQARINPEKAPLCSALPLTFYDRACDASKFGALQGGLRGMTEVVETNLLKFGHSPKKAWMVSNGIYYSSAFTINFVSYQIQQDYLTSGVLALKDIATLAAFSFAFNTVSKGLQWGARHLSESGWNITSGFVSSVANVASLLPFAYQTYQDPKIAPISMTSGLAANVATVKSAGLMGKMFSFFSARSDNDQSAPVGPGVTQAATSNSIGSPM